MAVYLKYGKGPDIKGAATAKGYKDWIELTSMGFAASRAVSIRTGGGAAKRHRSVPEISNLVCTKLFDNASLPLYNAALGGVKETNVELHCVKSGDSATPEAYMKIKLAGVLCTDYTLSAADGEEGLSDSFSLNWAEIDIEYLGADPKGLTKPARVSYNMMTATAD